MWMYLAQIMALMLTGCVCFGHSKRKIDNITLAQQFLDQYNIDASDAIYRNAVARWNYFTNLTAENEQISIETSANEIAFDKEAAHNASMFDWEKFEGITKRLFSKIANPGVGVLDEVKLNQYNQLSYALERQYNEGVVCNKTVGTCYPLYPDLVSIMSTSNDWDELLWAWKGWRDAVGRPMKDDYAKYVELSNEASRLLDYSDTGEVWRSSYEDPNFEVEIDRIWGQLKPLYKQVHTYVRRKLRDKYSRDFPATGHIPAHVLGNMWAQDWSSLAEFLTPYPDAQSLDITSILIKQNYTVKKIYQTAEQFFQSLGLPPLPQEFWDLSLLERPKDDRQLFCRPASARNMFKGNDFRILMCTLINHVDFNTVHHEMGHVYYYILYNDQPVPFQAGANPGFHEALGDLMSLSVNTPEHLYTIGLLDQQFNSEASDINFLMSMVLDRLSFLPFGYLVDKWRWSVFSGQTLPSEYNQKWWELRCTEQGVSPPNLRSNDDFDPGSKYHIVASVPYIRYFVSFILQFQFHKSLCDASNYTGPLHRCDIYDSKEAGKKLSAMLELGASVPWQDAMEKLTGTRQMDASPLIEYFQPIITWLENENQGETVGWEDGCPPGTFTYPPTPSPTVSSASNPSHIPLLLLLCVQLVHQIASKHMKL